MEVTRFLPLIGRLLIGLPFLMSGFGKLTTYAATTGYIGSVGLPLAPLGWAIAVAFEIGGGLLLVLGFRAREVAFGLAVFTLATAVFFHRNFADQNQMIHFLKNILEPDASAWTRAIRTMSRARLFEGPTPGRRTNPGRATGRGADEHRARSVMCEASRDLHRRSDPSAWKILSP
jgi:putative oxidoreductase